MALIDNCIAYWKFDEAAGDSVADSLSAHNGTCTGTPAIGAGKIGNARTFTGTGKYVTMPQNTDLGTASNTITLTAWVKPSAYGNYPTIMTRSDNDIAWKNYLWGFSSTTGKQAIVIGAGGWNVAATATGTGAWKFLCVVIDAGNGTFYLNGVADGTFSGVSWTAAENWYHKISYYGANAGFEGEIDEAGIWSRALSGAEITSLYNGGAGLAYPFGPDFTKMQININDAWKAGAGMQIQILDSWKQVAGMQLQVSDSWKTVF